MPFLSKVTMQINEITTYQFPGSHEGVFCEYPFIAIAIMNFEVLT
jgi:hypothetical protein